MFILYGNVSQTGFRRTPVGVPRERESDKYTKTSKYKKSINITQNIARILVLQLEIFE